MPELPEVETAARGLRARLVGHTIERCTVHDARLRWPVPDRLPALVAGQPLVDVYRRAKYLLMAHPHGTVIVHLGMSGSLRILAPQTERHRHEHVVWTLISDHGERSTLRLRDHRRFGSVLWTDSPVEAHPLLRGLGPEPLGNAFSGEHLYARSRGRRVPIKAFIMDAKTVAGVGNIYATEALYRAGIHPVRAAGRVALGRYETLAGHIRAILGEAIERGGTTLRDFAATDGASGYFVQSLDAYGRGGEPCPRCQATLLSRMVAQRSTVYCPGCQT